MSSRGAPGAMHTVTELSNSQIVARKGGAMASIGLTQKQRLAHWEASMSEVLRMRRRRTRYGQTSTEREAMHGFKFEKATDDGKAQP
jgi:hypothetical protein